MHMLTKCYNTKYCFDLMSPATALYFVKQSLNFVLLQKISVAFIISALLQNVVAPDW